MECGETNPIVLDFDHINPIDKTASISRMLGQNIAMATILAEVSKCEIRCAKCHRLRTAKQMGWYEGVNFDKLDTIDTTKWDALLDQKWSEGEDRPQAKLTNDQVRCIIASTNPTKELAAQFLVDTTTIQRIKSRRSWAHLSKTVLDTL